MDTVEVIEVASEEVIEVTEVATEEVPNLVEEVFNRMHLEGEEVLIIMGEPNMV